MSSPPPDHQHVSRLMQVLDEHWVLTLATNATRAPGATPDELLSAPHCTPVFYARTLDPKIGTTGIGTPCPKLLFASNPDSAHGQHIGAGPRHVGAAIYLETETVGQLRGVQMRGLATRLQRSSAAHSPALKDYLRRHPVAQALLAQGKHELYCLRITWAKLTDNRLGFGTHPIVSFDPGNDPDRDPPMDAATD